MVMRMIELRANPATAAVPAYLANGVIGLRLPANPLDSGWATVSGFCTLDPATGVEQNAFAPWPLGLSLTVDADAIVVDELAVTQWSYDLSCSELTAVAQGRGLRLTSLAFASRSLPTVVCQAVTVQVDRPGRVTLELSLDAGGNDGRPLWQSDGPQARGRVDGALQWTVDGEHGTLGAAIACEADRLPESHQRQVAALANGRGFAVRFTWEAQPNRPVIFHRIAAMLSDLTHAQPHLQAVRLAYLAADRGFDSLRAENREAWAALWRSRIIIDADDPQWQRLADACFSYLHSSIHPLSPCSTGLFGLGTWPGYHCFRGHIFWDIETFAYPPVLLTAPDSAMAMLDYRWRHVEAARRNAAMHGRRGLQFPWESGQRSGEEATPTTYPQIIHEQHVTLDVAMAFAQMAHCSADGAFVRDRAWPVLHGVAEWIVSRGKWTGRGFEIHRTMGICEDRASDNNAFVNMAACCVLDEAIALADRLKQPPPAAWRAVREAMVVPRDAATGIIARRDDDAGEPCTETLAAFYPYTFDTDRATYEATVKYYLQRGDTGAHMPMLPPLLPIHAARLGDADLTLDLLRRGCAEYVIEPFAMMDEFGWSRTQTKPKVGPYLAHAGAYLMNLLIGLPGLRPSADAPESWPTHPVTLPRGWSSIHATVPLRGSHYRLTAREGGLVATVTRVADG
jgi:trehalose/maltose hydrolase-like predicted phosphorylase